MLTRRDFLKISAAAGAASLLPLQGQVQPVTAQPLLLDPATQPKFVNPVPNPLAPSFIFQPADDTHYEIGMYQFQQSLGLIDPATGAPLMTMVWGYGGAAQAHGFPLATYPGRTFIAQRDQQITVHWTNNLIDGGTPLPHLLPVDTTLHWANPASWPSSGVPTVPHVHGGHTESDSDGLPEYWFTPGFAQKGPRWVKETYVYDNDQQAGTIWYHDHALGITRLNVYAGLAGFYIIRDNKDTGSPNNPLGLPTFPYEVPLVIQDRLFTAGGQLFYPTTSPELPSLAPDPSVLPEVFGDVILVNGQAWPVLTVEPRLYRFRILNGSDSRFYNMWINSGNADTANPDGNGPMIHVIGTDDGLLPAPIPRDQLTIGPGERYDVLVDFSGWSGQTLIMRNNARSPFPKGATPNPQNEGQIMAFRVGTEVADPTNNTLPTALNPVASLTGAVRTRKLLLFEGTDEFGRLQPMLGVAEPTQDVNSNTINGTLLWNEEPAANPTNTGVADGYPITENPGLNDVEIWEVYNTTADAHPIHLHLVHFQILSRQGFKGTLTPKTLTAHDGSTSLGGILTNISLKGQPKGPGAYEAGWKDTAIMYPGEVTRIIAKFDRPGRYVWHCHILAHEDHEMMRPYHVGPMSGAANAAGASVQTETPELDESIYIPIASNP